MNDPLPTSIAAQLSKARAVLERHLGETIIAIHLFGSAVDGGLKRFSDIDLLVTVADPPSEATRRELMMELLSVSAPPGTDAELRALEVTVLAKSEIVPWRYPARREMQFGEWLRENLKAGIYEPPTLDHDLAILLTKARQHSVTVVGCSVIDLFEPIPRAHLIQSLRDTVAQWNQPEDWAGDERNIVLALARIWYTGATGQIASKDAACAWLLERTPPANQQVLRKALAAYRGEEDDDLASHGTEVAAFVRYARTAIEQLCSARP
ncbi:AadA family aminoglycoside 3''-O-nucleotidyltransferase [Steroidobacter sp. S1-65]|uniref:Aminoglycoside (3'') (9) adenylyltransferase n=1 Tax=Steroidobacter gossypii TaxID=2805490 RepID=A0ABS1X146_9GAMM|nr:AadA family aminoglycoside 3''-O-nucleotidyltransferase [Steroidobacter gossypii]MBM0106970.1 AadA family aminoglycoside 3''-O-nucleotidyltransferase [Steroidobacter gossypii]